MSDYSKVSSFLRNGNSEGVNLSEDELLKFIWDQVKFWSEEEARENFIGYDPHEGKDQNVLEEDTKDIFMKTMGQISHWAFEQRGSYPNYDESDLSDGEMKMGLGGS